MAMSEAEVKAWNSGVEAAAKYLEDKCLEATLADVLRTALMRSALKKPEREDT